MFVVAGNGDLSKKTGESQKAMIWLWEDNGEDLENTQCFYARFVAGFLADQTMKQCGITCFSPARPIQHTQFQQLQVILSSGEIKSFNPNKGYGFVGCEAGPQVESQQALVHLTPKVRKSDFHLSLLPDNLGKLGPKSTSCSQAGAIVLNQNKIRLLQEILVFGTKFGTKFGTSAISPAISHPKKR